MIINTNSQILQKHAEAMSKSSNLKDKFPTISISRQRPDVNVSPTAQQINDPKVLENKIRTDGARDIHNLSSQTQNATSTVQDMNNRMQDLSRQASNSNYTDEERKVFDVEYQNLAKEITSVLQNSEGFHNSSKGESEKVRNIEVKMGDIAQFRSTDSAEIINSFGSIATQAGATAAAETAQANREKLDGIQTAQAHTFNDMSKRNQDGFSLSNAVTERAALSSGVAANRMETYEMSDRAKAFKAEVDRILAESRQSPSFTGLTVNLDKSNVIRLLS